MWTNPSLLFTAQGGRKRGGRDFLVPKLVPKHGDRGCKLEFYSDSRAGDVRFRSIPIPTPTGGSCVGGMVAQGVSKYCIFNEDFRYVFKSAIGAVVYELR